MPNQYPNRELDFLTNEQRLAAEREGVFVPPRAGFPINFPHNANFVRPDYYSRRNAMIEQSLATGPAPAPIPAPTQAGANMQVQAVPSMANSGNPYMPDLAAEGRRKWDVEQWNAAMRARNPNYMPGISGPPLESILPYPQQSGARLGTIDHYRQTRLAETAGMKIPSSGSLFNRNAIRPDQDMHSSPGLVDPVEQQQYKEQVAKLEHSTLRRMAQQPNAFKTLEEVDRFIKDDFNYSETISAAAADLAEKIIGKTAPELYKQWQQQGKVEEANKLAETQGSETRYELDPATGMIRERPLSPEQEHDIAMRKAGTDISVDEAMQLGMPVIQLGDNLIGPADRRYKAFTKQIPVYEIERNPDGSPRLDKAGGQIYAEGPDGEKVISGYRTVPIEGAQAYNPPPQAPVTPGKGFITNVATGQTIASGGQSPQTSITDQSGRVVTPAMAQAAIALQNPLLSPAARAYLESKMPQQPIPATTPVVAPKASSESENVSDDDAMQYLKNAFTGKLKKAGARIQEGAEKAAGLPGKSLSLFLSMPYKMEQYAETLGTSAMNRLLEYGRKEARKAKTRQKAE